jgi:hypothetical protein
MFSAVVSARTWPSWNCAQIGVCPLDTLSEQATWNNRSGISDIPASSCAFLVSTHTMRMASDVANHFEVDQYILMDHLQRPLDLGLSGDLLRDFIEKLV